MYLSADCEQKKLELTTFPRIFIHVCQFKSIVFAIYSSASWRVLQFPPKKIPVIIASGAKTGQAAEEPCKQCTIAESRGVSVLSACERLFARSTTFEGDSAFDRYVTGVAEETTALCGPWHSLLTISFTFPVNVEGFALSNLLVKPWSQAASPARYVAPFSSRRRFSLSTVRRLASNFPLLILTTPPGSAVFA